MLLKLYDKNNNPQDLQRVTDILNDGGLIIYPNDGAGFANGSTAADKASAVAVEVWSTVTPATGSATQFSCVTPASQEVTISTAANAVVYYPMSARLVVEKNKTVNNVTAGKFSAPATFTVTYN